MRFTVHESPDYYSLKVSVFNDDKKTELIGETFVNLEEVIAPGGGQSDTWHSLTCKGKYAGEIRLELTYYDTRPKQEEQPVEKKQSQRSGGSDVQMASTIGPREMTPVKRRPLPSDPTGASPSPSSGHRHTPTRGQSIPQVQPGSGSHRHTYYGGQRAPDNRRPLPDMTPPNQRKSYYDPQSVGHNSFDRGYPEQEIPANYSHDDINNQAPGVSPPIPRHVDQRHPASDEARFAAYNSSQNSGHRPQSYAPMAHSYSDPVLHHHHSNDPIQASQLSLYHASSADQYNGAAFEQPDDFRMQPGQFHGSFSSHHSMQPTVEDEDDIPPPPPVHRSSAPAASYAIQPAQYQPDLAPAPLRITPSPRPYADQNGLNDSFNSSYDHRYSQSPAESHSRPVSRGGSTGYSPARVDHPLSLTAGFDTSMQEHYSSSARPGSQMGPESTHRGSVSSYQAYDPAMHQRHLSHHEYSTPPNYETPPRHHQLSQAEPTSTHASPLYQNQVDQTAPLIKPRPVSPAVADYRSGRMPNRSTPTRKSVSPRPPPSTNETSERRLSSVPFSPDSFDEFNPRVAAAKDTSTSPTSGGSIVGFDGRVIDPSDHLPVDSWAPEPEPKGKDKERSSRPLRERHIMGARDLHRRERSDRDIRNSVLTASSGNPAKSEYNADTSPLANSSSGRNRLQKKPRGDSNPSSMSSSSNVERASQHYAYSPSPYSAAPRQERRALPPPIPAKIPLNADPHDEMARFSAEMSMIDIGSSNRRGPRAVGAPRITDGMGMTRYR